jgi:hypothetical protein
MADIMSDSGDSNFIKLIYHVVQHIIDYNHDKSGSTRYVDMLCTYTSLAAAKYAGWGGSIKRRVRQGRIRDIRGE